MRRKMQVIARLTGQSRSTVRIDSLQCLRRKESKDSPNLVTNKYRLVPLKYINLENFEVKLITGEITQELHILIPPDHQKVQHWLSLLIILTLACLAFLHDFLL